MGRKYGSLHIRTEGIGENIDALVNSCLDAVCTVYPSNIEQVAVLLGLKLSQQQIPLLNQFIRSGSYARATHAVAEHNGFVSIYDQRVTFENIQEIAQRLNTLLNLPVFFSSVYDDDVFIFGLCENGKVVSTHVSGNCESYDLTNKNYNIEKLERYLSDGENNIPELGELSGSDMESALSNILGFRLDSDDRYATS